MKCVFNSCDYPEIQCVSYVKKFICGLLKKIINYSQGFHKLTLLENITKFDPSNSMGNNHRGVLLQ